MRLWPAYYTPEVFKDGNVDVEMVRDDDQKMQMALTDPKTYHSIVHICALWVFC